MTLVWCCWWHSPVFVDEKREFVITESWRECEIQQTNTWVEVAQQEGNLPGKLRVPSSNSGKGWIGPGQCAQVGQLQPEPEHTCHNLLVNESHLIKMNSVTLWLTQYFKTNKKIETIWCVLKSKTSEDIWKNIFSTLTKHNPCNQSPFLYAVGSTSPAKCGRAKTSSTQETQACSSSSSSLGWKRICSVYCTSIASHI